MGRLAFEPFGKVDLTKPFKLVPLGNWYRDDRELDITSSILEEIAANFGAGLPNYRVPINLDHEDKSGKVGEIKAVAYLEEGPSGPGLYVTEYVLSDTGQKAIDESGYDAVSAEIVWSMAGSSYQDPRTGQEHDNVLVGVALTPYPFFGHGEVALFSQKANKARDIPAEDRIVAKIIAKLTELFKQAEPEEWPAEIAPEAQSMATEQLVQEVKAEEAAQLRQEAEKLAARADAAEKRVSELEAEKVKAALRTEALSFKALGIPVDVYVEKMAALRQASPEGAAWALETLKAADEALVGTGILNETGTEEEGAGDGSDDFIQAIEVILTREFKGDRAQYAAAMKLATKQFPNLAADYAAGVS